ncbi:MAG: hypothetical protein ACN6QE_03970 [Pseudomonas putida]
MAGSWEPVNGVYWSAPPPVVVADEGWPLSMTIMWGVVAAFVITAVLKYISHKIRPQSWGLRKHLGAIGVAITLAYLAVILPMIWGRADALLTMPLNEVGDFLAGAFGPVAFFWLVMGFLQQGEELRLSTTALEMQADELQQGTKALLLQAEELKNSVEQQSIMAAAATQQIEAQHRALEMQRSDRERALLANFTIRTIGFSGGGAPGMVVNTVNLRNNGNHAYNAVLRFSPPLGDNQMRSLGDRIPDSQTEFSIRFPSNTGEPIRGTATLEYADSEGHSRQEIWSYVLADSSVEYSKLRASDSTTV